jgi:hypothetical protein
MLIKVNMQARVHRDLSFVLHIRQEIAQSMHPVVIDESDDSDDFGIALADFPLDQMIAYQVANRFRTILVSHTADA